MIVEWKVSHLTNTGGIPGSIVSCRFCHRSSMLWYKSHIKGWRMYDPQIGPDITKLYIDLDKPHYCRKAQQGYFVVNAKRGKKRIKSI